MNLGKKVPPPPAPAKPDVIERVGNVWKVNGKFQTNKPAPPAPPPHIPQGWDAVVEAMQKQTDDGFPLNEFGVM